MPNVKRVISSHIHIYIYIYIYIYIIYTNEIETAVLCFWVYKCRKKVSHANRLNLIDTTDIIEKIVSEYTKGKKLGPQERDNMFPIICMLRRLGVGDPPRFGSHSIESIEYVLGKKISVTRREMLQQAFQIPTQSPVAAVDSGIAQYILKSLRRIKELCSYSAISSRI